MTSRVRIDIGAISAQPVDPEIRREALQQRECAEQLRREQRVAEFRKQWETRGKKPRARG